MPFLLHLQNGQPLCSYSLSESTVVGRSTQCQLQFLDKAISRRHFRVFFKKEQWWLEDLQSKNGTWLGGRRVDHPVIIEGKEQITAGSQVFFFDPPAICLPQRNQGPSACLITLDPQDDSVVKMPLLQAKPDPKKERALALMLEQKDFDQILTLIAECFGAEFKASQVAILGRSSDGDMYSYLVQAEKDPVWIYKRQLRQAEQGPWVVKSQGAIDKVALGHGRLEVVSAPGSVLAGPLVDSSQVLQGLVQVVLGAGQDVDLNWFANICQAAGQALSWGLRLDLLHRKSPRPGAEYLGQGPKTREVLDQAFRAAAGRAPVFLSGEPGTGKEALAQLIHQKSPRAEGPFLVLKCREVPQDVLAIRLFGHEKDAFEGADQTRTGYLEQARGGTLLLKEVGYLAPELQLHLEVTLKQGSFFRLGGERPVWSDARVMASSSIDLAQQARLGRFRTELLGRLAVFHLDLPPLRERSEEIEALARHFLRRSAEDLGLPEPRLAPPVLAALAHYPWPANVAELRNLMEKLVLAGLVEIKSDDLPLEVLQPPVEKGVPGSLGQAVAALEKKVISHALRSLRWRKSEAAQRLGISRPTLNKKIKDFEILPED